MRPRRYSIALASMLLLATRCAPAFAEEPTEPVVALYKAAIRDKSGSVLEDAALRKGYFTTSFEAIVASIAHREKVSNSAILDFDPILSTNGDGDAADLAIKLVKQDLDVALVVATFGRAKERRSVGYILVRAAGKWLVDDIRSAPGAKGVDIWSVRDISDDDLGIQTK